MKPWQTKEWRDKREAFLLGKICDSCGSTINLVIHHNKSLLPYQNHLQMVSGDFLHSKIREGEYSTEKVFVQTCPHCHTHRPSDLRTRKKKKPLYRCINCGFEFDTPGSRLVDTGRLSRSDWGDYWSKYEDTVKEIVLAQRDEFHEYYITFEDCTVLCNRCHLALHKGMKLCTDCKEKYHKTKWKTCWDCFLKTPRGQEVLKEKQEEEYENQLVEYENPLCGKVHEVERWRLEFEGIFNFCHNDCDPYNCDKFEKWYEERMQ